MGPPAERPSPPPATKAACSTSSCGKCWSERPGVLRRDARTFDGGDGSGCWTGRQVALEVRRHLGDDIGRAPLSAPDRLQRLVEARAHRVAPREEEIRLADLRRLDEDPRIVRLLLQEDV